MGKGTVMFECKNGDQKALQEVYYIPKLCNNVISLGQMTEDGNKVQMAGDTMKVSDKSGKLLMLFTIMDPFYSDEANDVTNGETRNENVTPPEATEIPIGGEASPSTYSPTT
ncbi:hypothetical protein V6N13_108427 [Hibiscus sabdariffa]